MANTAILREQILAFRLQRHNLARRLPAGSLVEAAAVCGIQNSPPGAALLSLHARVEEVSAAALDATLLGQKRLVQLWSVRAAPLLVPVEDAAIFTHGLLPQDEAELRFFIKGAGDHLRRLDMTASELVAATGAALYETLDGRQLTKDELGVELSLRLAPQIPADRLTLWNSPDEWGHFGESLVRFALYAVALQGMFCVISHRGGPATFVRSDQWLGHPFPAAEPAAAARELVLRYLAAYGPSTMQDLAQWAGIAPSRARRTWQLAVARLVPVSLGGRELWLLRDDLPVLQAAALPEGVRLLPPHDPYLAARDRTLLLPDKKLHAQVWRVAGSPGVVLYGGEIVATWQAQKKGSALQVGVTAYDRMPGLQDAVEAEAAALARLRSCRRADVVFAEHD